MQNKRDELFTKMVLDAWFSKLKRADELFSVLSDENLEDETSKGKNRGIYLLGHLTAVHDAMLPLLGFGEALYPEFYDMFVTKPDRAVANLPTMTILRNSWHKVMEKLVTSCNSLTANEWFEKHNSVSEIDFNKEPHRNKLNVIISRTNHLDYHLGQLILLKKV
ncbi:MAG: DinB family protein [Saprospiraceae bacterium]